MAIRCPECGLVNPNRTILCDCGQPLNTNVDQATLAKAQQTNLEMAVERANRELEQQRVERKVGRGLGLGRVLLRLFGG